MAPWVTFITQSAVRVCFSQDQRVRRAFPKPLEYIRKDLEIVYARGEDASQTEKDFVAITRVNHLQRRGRGDHFRRRHRHSVRSELTTKDDELFRFQIRHTKVLLSPCNPCRSVAARL